MGLQASLKKLLIEVEYFTSLSQFTDYKAGLGATCTEDARKAGACMEPYKWWLTFGAGKPCLQKAATKILSQNPQSSACERNWSTYDWVMGKKRNRLAPANAEKLVYIFHNMRAIRKIENVAVNT